MDARVCRYCGRPLTSARSILAGAGQKCRAKHGQQLDLFMEASSNRPGKVYQIKPHKILVKLDGLGIIRAALTGRVWKRL